jgi:hypothetical protein
MRYILSALFMAVVAGPVAANDFRPAMEAFLDAEIRAWSHSSDIVAAIAAQNASNGAMDQAAIDEMDATWRAEIGSGATPTIDSVLQNAAADFLRAQVDASGGRITEVFIMDQNGLNVAASGVTSDMWQGDEEKFTETYSVGADAAHFSEIELDESTQRYQGQISMTIIDPATGQPIGAITVGVDAESLL